MKRKNLIVVFCALCITVMFAAVGCGTLTEKYDKSISEIRDRVYEGRGNAFSVTAVSGRHEQPFKPDGTAGEKTDFTVITLTPDEFMRGSLYTYTLTLDGTAYSGLLTMHPFGESYSAELSVRAREAAIELNIKLGASDETVELACVSEEDDITPDAVLETALKTLENDLKPYETKTGYDCEIYIRFIPNPINADGGYYWYAAFVTDKETLAVLLERKTGTVIGIKN